MCMNKANRRQKGVRCFWNNTENLYFFCVYLGTVFKLHLWPAVEAPPAEVTLHPVRNVHLHCQNLQTLPSVNSQRLFSDRKHKAQNRALKSIKYKSLHIQASEHKKDEICIYLNVVFRKQQTTFSEQIILKPTSSRSLILSCCYFYSYLHIQKHSFYFFCD